MPADAAVAAVVHQHRAVGVHGHQRAGLVELGGGERDAELHRRDRQSALDQRMSRVPGGDRFAPSAVIAVASELRDQLRRDVVFDRHAVMRDIARRIAIQVALAHVERVQAQRVRDIAEDGLDRDHALRSAEAAERRVGLGMGAAAQRLDVDIRQEIGVVRMKDRTVVDRPGQVRAETALAGHHQLQPGEQAIGLETDGIAVQVVVPLAGDHEVVVAIQAHLHRVPGLVRGQGGPDRDVPGLRLFAPEAAAHAPALDLDGVLRQAQRMRDPVLDFSRVLAGDVDEPAVLLLADRIGDLPLQVEVFLAADPEFAGQRAGAGLDGGLRVAAPQPHRRQYVCLLRHGVVDAEDCRQRFDVARHQAGGAQRRAMRGGHHQRHQYRQQSIDVPLPATAACAPATR